MKIHFAFPDERISFDCKVCGGSCCHVNNHLILSENTKTDLDKHYPHISQHFITNLKGSELLYCAKNCWFWDKNIGCKLPNRNIEKPLTCELYPLKITKINNYFFVITYQPCPYFFIDMKKFNSRNTTSISYDKSYSLIENYIATAPQHLTEKEYPNIKKERLFEEKNYQSLFLRNPEQYFDRVIDDEYKKFVLLYCQFRWNPKILRLPLKWSKELINVYVHTINKVVNNNTKLDDLNFYLLLGSEFYKSVDKFNTYN